MSIRSHMMTFSELFTVDQPLDCRIKMSPRKPPPSESPATSEPPARRRRLSAQERELSIARGAVQFFAEVGFDGDTRQLAQRLGITQSLIFRHFPTKKALVDRVYQEVYVGRWNPFWETVIVDRTMTLSERLKRLYKDYARAALTWDWVRIYMFSGLRGEDINRRYLGLLRSRILEPIAAEVRNELGLPPPGEVSLSELEIELVWGINARIFYFGQRRWIFGVPLEEDIDTMIDLTIDHFMGGVRQAVPDIVDHTLRRRRQPRKSSLRRNVTRSLQ